MPFGVGGLLCFLDPLIRESRWAVGEDLMLQIESDRAGFPFSLCAMGAAFALVWWLLRGSKFPFVVAGCAMCIAWYVV